MSRREFEHEYDLEKLQAITPKGRDFRMLVTPRFIDHYGNNRYEEFTSNLLSNYLNDNSLFIDIGAHYGYYTLLAGTRHPGCQIICFEPAPQNFEILKQNVELNRLLNVTVHNLALSDKSENKSFNIAEASDNSGFYEHPMTSTRGVIDLQAVTLDSVLIEVPKRPIVIKIDTEGHELNVLEGMEKILKKAKDVRLIIEFNPKCLRSAGHEPADLLKKIQQLDFEIYFIDDDRSLTYKLDVDRADKWPDYVPEASSIFGEKTYINLLCIKKEKSLSVCFFSHSARLDGAERSLLELVSELTIDHGVICSVTLPVDGPLKSRLEEAGAATMVVPYLWWGDFALPASEDIDGRLHDSFKAALRNMLQQMDKINPDIIFTNTMAIPWGAVTASFLSKPHVWFVREFGIMDHGITFFQPFESVVEFIINTSNIILTNSDAVRKTLFGDVAAKNIMTSYMHIDIPADSVSQDENYYFKVAKSTKLVLSGRMSEGKGQRDAVLAFKELINRRLDVELVLMGDDTTEYAPLLRKTVKDAGLEAQVRFIGFKENPYPVISQADIVLVCSRNEAFGRVALEAMLLKKPVIGTDSGGTPELISDGYNGLLYAPGNYLQLADKIEHLIHHKGMIKKYGGNGYKFASHKFTKEAYGGKIFKLLKGLKKAKNPVDSPFIDFISKLVNGMFKDLEKKTCLIGELENTVQARDAQLTELNTALQTRDAQLTDRDAHLAAVYTALQNRDAQFAEIEAQMLQINQGVVVQIMARFRSLINKLLRPGTRPFYYYELALTGMRIILIEGWKSFFRRARERFTRSATKPGKAKLNLPKFKASISKKEAEKLIFAIPSDEPEVSIIIPAYNNWRYTLNCLKSISENTGGDFEVILVDDCSTDGTANILSKSKNLNIINTKNNSGFVDSCNFGVEASKGRYILFLNNDTLVTRNWLPPMLELIKRKDVGAVGSKLVYPDGRLQEAGNIIWKDGNGWNYGRNDDPTKPEYNFWREVDYCSGACLLIRKDLFIQAGKFDNRYKPAYYEDTDICFSLRKAGYKTIYQPKSVVVHLEGVSCGTDITTGTKRHQETNREKFLMKWRDILNSNHYEYDTDKLLCARTQNKGKRILVIDQWAPRYDRDSGSLRMSYILRILKELNYNVTFIGDDLLNTQPYSSVLEEQGIETPYQPYISRVEDYLRANAKCFDICWLSRPPIAIKYIDIIRSVNPKARLIYDTVDLAFLRLKREAEINHNNETARLSDDSKKQELYLMRNTDKTVVVSEYEKQLIESENPSLDINIVSNIHDIYPPVKCFSERKDILFVGGFDHMPNIDAANYFVKDIFPMVKKELPDLKIYIVGNIPSHHPCERILDLKTGDVIVTGYVKDLTAYFENCRVFVAPLRFGAGVKGKINQCMSHGLPVVTTDIGAESIHMVDGENGLIANDARMFADKIIRLYTDEQLWKKISSNSIKNIEEHFSIGIAKEQIRKLIEGLSFPQD